MARINGELFSRIKKVLGVTDQRVYARIQQEATRSRLPRYLAAISLAADLGININRYASDEDLATLRNVTRTAEIAPIHTPSELRSSKANTPRKTKPRREKRRGTSVFVVHGRNERITRSLFSFLRAVGLVPVEWNKAIAKTKKGAPYVGDILDAAFEEAVAVVVLLTPDDEAKLKNDFLKQNDPIHERVYTGQARANVLFEAGMAFGKNPNSTVLVQVGQVRPFSDVGGRHVVHLSNAASTRQELVTKLANAGCNVDTTGQDWLTEGDFTFEQRGSRRKR
jgi:predicted nucleotide-binding protein